VQELWPARVWEPSGVQVRTAESNERSTDGSASVRGWRDCRRSSWRLAVFCVWRDRVRVESAVLSMPDAEADGRRPVWWLRRRLRIRCSELRGAQRRLDAWPPVRFRVRPARRLQAQPRAAGRLDVPGLQPTCVWLPKRVQVRAAEAGRQRAGRRAGDELWGSAVRERRRRLQRVPRRGAGHQLCGRMH
jgi:hypothetical protein